MLSILTELENIQFAGAAEAFRMWVCKLVMFIQILRKINGLYQRKELKSGCAAELPVHLVPPTLFSNMSNRAGGNRLAPNI